MTTTERVKEILFVRSALSFMQLGVVLPIEVSEDNEGGIAVAKNPLSSSRASILMCSGTLFGILLKRRRCLLRCLKGMKRAHKFA